MIDDSRREMAELYDGVVTKEELARIDAQPNPFNFSDRVSQTTKLLTKVSVPHLPLYQLLTKLNMLRLPDNHATYKRKYTLLPKLPNYLSR